MIGVALVIYLVLGLIVAQANDRLVMREHSEGAERGIYFLRATLSWPTYLLEDFLLIGRMNGGDDA